MSLRRRLLVPILRLRQQPRIAARGTLVGLAWAFTPTFGIRMPLVFLTWLVARHLCRWDFSLLIGLAWTWTTNIVVLGPLYFGFYLTGRMLRGQWQDLAGFDAFRQQAAAFTEPDAALADRIMTAAHLLLGDWGLTLWLGALPWSVLMATLGYFGALRFLRHRAQRRSLRRLGKEALP